MTTTTARPQIDVHIRWTLRRDMPEVLAIENQCFEFPWDEDSYIRCLRNRNVIGMVAEAGERIVGFMIYELHKSKLHIVNFSGRAWSWLNDTTQQTGDVREVMG